jgi:hypothetical protein
MDALRLGRLVVGALVAIEMLAGCGGAGTTASVPPALTQNVAHHRTTSSSGDLLYAIGGCNGTCVLSYPSGKLVGRLDVNGNGICSDDAGNVFIASAYVVTEYAHGGQTPVATLSVPAAVVGGCSVDPKTNNLAVVAFASAGDIAVFQNERGTPTYYNSIIDALYCGYDDAGNLFVNGYVQSGYAFAELPSGSSKFLQLSINQSVGTPGQVQWDGKYITYQGRGTGIGTVSRLAISGSAATVVSTSSFTGMKHRPFASWIYNGRVVMPYVYRAERANAIGIWDYPKGGKPRRLIKHVGSYKNTETDFQGVAVSVAPSQSRIRN